MKKQFLFLFVIGILSSCSKDNVDIQEFVLGEVSVGIKSGTNINAIFDFINQFDHSVDNINSLTFTSDLPSNNLQNILDNLNAKIYTNGGVNWLVTGYLHYQSNQITIFPRLFGIDNIEYQNDWLTSMNELELNEKHNIELNSGIIRFIVPIGKELEWKNQFENFNIVDWAKLNYIADIEPHTN